MKNIAGGFAKLIASYLAVILAIILLPVFLITSDTSFFDSLMNFIFKNNS